MIVPDINLLVFAHNCKAPHYEAARAWWSSSLAGRTPIGLSWVTINGFIRIMTHQRILVHPMPVEQAIAYSESWLAESHIKIIEPGKNFSHLFFNYLQQLGTGGNLTTDAYLTALAAEHNAELHSNDSDFSKFAGLRWKNPLH